jgi:hypothetical protein
MWLALASVAPLVLTGCEDVELGGASAGDDSPQAVTKSLISAIDAGDVGAAYDCFTPETQDVVVGAIVVMGAGLQVMSAEAEKKNVPLPPAMVLIKSAGLEPILQKHGITADAVPDLKSRSTPPSFGEFAKYSNVVDDKRGLFAELGAALMEMAKQQGQVLDMKQFTTGELTDVKIEGDTATAVFKRADGQEDLLFKKTAGGWKLHIDSSKMSPGAATMPPIFGGGAPRPGAGPPAQ